ncbi:MAG: ribonuclease HII [Candidatus Caldarchaeum sp.]|nr:ribonuclease HII [Candidatus Caldarchaeum sp.]
MADVLVCGVDEAGRGCVVGPLVVSAFLANSRDSKMLRELGVADSKTLTRRRRQELFNKLAENFEYETAVVPPTRITSSLRSMGGRGLNELEYFHIARLIDKLGPRRVYVDSPDRNTSRARKRILDYLSADVEVVCMVRGDRRNVFVAAASIVAKVVRDEKVERLRRVLGDFGSGYPSDPKTRFWLSQRLDSADVSQFVRLGWRTIDRVRQTTLDMF